MTELFGRSVRLTIGNLELSQFDCRFRVEKTMKPEPNKALIEVYNLSPEHRGRIAEQAHSKSAQPKKNGETSTKVIGNIPVRLEAGYGETLEQIYFGNLITVKSEFDGSDWLTSVSSGDGDKAVRTARCNVSFGPKTPIAQAMNAILSKLGLGTGNLASVVQKLRSGSVTFPRGAVFSGPAAKCLTDLCKSADLEWYVEDGKPVFVSLNKALSGEAIRLSPSTGLIGSPSADASGKLTCTALMVPGLRCGRLVVLDSRAVKGAYRIEKITYDGDRAGQNWYAEIEGQRY